MKGFALRRWLAGFGIAGVALAGLTWPKVQAEAAEAINDVTLTWAINNEVGAGAHFGGCNFLVAGLAGDAGSSRLWTEADGFYSASSGNVKIEKQAAGGGWETPTWATKCLGADGAAVAVSGTTGNRLVLSGGSGSLDRAAGTATINWTGSFSVVFYGGMTYWSATDPALEVRSDGTASLTATGTGYQASMGGGTTWAPITPRTITLANFAGVDLAAAGGSLTLVPRYADVTVTTPSGSVTGAFPQSFVDFQQLTGQTSYWYGDGANKVPGSVLVSWAAGPPPPSVVVSRTVLSADGASELTISGTGFDPSLAIATNPPLMGRSGGVYIAFGLFGADWRPSMGAPSSARPTAAVKWAVLAADVPVVGGADRGGIELLPDGSFSTTLSVSKEAADVAGTVGGTYGIYTYAGGGARVASFETVTPLVFEPGIPIEVEVPEAEEPPDPTGEFSWTITSNPAVSLGTAVQSGSSFSATGTLPSIKVTDTRSTHAPWTLNGQVTDLVKGSDRITAQSLGWVPSLSSNSVGAVAGGAVAPGVGLKDPKVLAWAAQNHPSGSVNLSAQLTLTFPSTTAPGNYVGRLTITAVG
ncbi:MAG: hypothetical protein FWG16_03885 [Micrococcales bacterium]|nr:hypothetical protein [Micrococcales bacterium]